MPEAPASEINAHIPKMWLRRRAARRAAGLLVARRGAPSCGCAATVEPRRRRSHAKKTQPPAAADALPPTIKRDVGILTLSQFVNNMGFGCVIPVLPIFATDMGLGASGVGLILSTSAVSRLCLNIPFGRLADTAGRKPLMLGGQVMTAAASFGTLSSASSMACCKLPLFSAR